MANVRFVGLDVHKDSITVAVTEGTAAAKVLTKIPHDLEKLRKVLQRLGDPGAVKVCYEAGGSGYVPARFLKKHGYDCMVVAPSLIPMLAGRRIKTDQRDAIKLAHFLRSGDLTGVYMPDPEDEAMRDLVRARGDAVKAQVSARHQLLKFLGRHGLTFRDAGNWTDKFWIWANGLKFELVAQQEVFLDYVRAVRECVERVKRLTDALHELVKTWKRVGMVRRLSALRGIDELSAATLVAELGDLRRFKSAGQLMAYLGLVPAEDSSGPNVRRGGITRTGNRHVRRVLVEASWNYRFQYGVSKTLSKRQEGQPPEVLEVSKKAQHRLCGKYRRLHLRGKCTQKIVVSVARELAGFVWALGQIQPA